MVSRSKALLFALLLCVVPSFALAPTVHHPLDALTPEEYSKIYNILQVAGKLESATGISQLTIDPLATNANGDPGAQIAIQQRVTGSLLFTFSTNVTSTQGQTVELQYDLNKRMSVSILRDQNGGYGIDGGPFSNVTSSQSVQDALAAATEEVERLTAAVRRTIHELERARGSVQPALPALPLNFGSLRLS